MTTILILGTPIQKAIDSAQPGDTLDVRAGTYAGRLRITKPLSIKGDGAVIIDGGTGDGAHTVNIDVGNKATGVGAKGVVLSGLILPNGSNAVRYNGDCTGSIIEHCEIGPVPWMYRGTGTSQTGGNGIAFDHASGIEARYLKIRKCRAPSDQYTVDGGPFEFYSAQRIYVHHNEVWDCVNSGEFGKSAGDPNNAEIRIEDNIFHGRPNPTTPHGDDKAILANGIFLRAVSGLIVARNTFDLVDYWALTFETGGTYGTGTYSDIRVRDNVFRLLPGVNRAYNIKSGIPLTAFYEINRNKVFTTSPTTRVAEIAGIKYNAGTLASFRADTGFEQHGAWTVGPLPPVVPIPPPQPVDPCATVKAERDAAIANLDTALGQLAAANGKVTALTTARDEALGMLADAERELDAALKSASRKQLALEAIAAIADAERLP